MTATLPQPIATFVPPKPPGPAGLPEWSALCQEKPMEPMLKILDCHHHFFDWSKAVAGDDEIPIPNEFRANFTNLPAMEPCFGVRNMVFESRHSHTDEEWTSGAGPCFPAVATTRSAASRRV